MPTEKNFYKQKPDSVGKIPIENGRSLETHNIMVPVEELQLDRENHRLVAEIERDRQSGEIKRVTEDFLFRYLMEHYNGKEMAESLLMSGGIDDNPVLITHTGTVVDGNRRTVGYRWNFQNGHLEFKMIPCDVLPPDVSQSDILTILSRRHVCGQLPWGGLNCAKSMKATIDANKWEPAQYAKMYGRPLSTVKTILEGLGYITQYQKQTGDYDPRKWNHLYKMASCKLIRQLRTARPEATGKDEQEFLEWAYNLISRKQVGDCRYVEGVAKCYLDKSVKEKLDNDISVKMNDVYVLGSANTATWADRAEKFRKSIEGRKFQAKNPLDRNDVAVLAKLVETIISRVPPQMWEMCSVSDIKFLGVIKSLKPIAETGFKGTSDFIGRFNQPGQIERGEAFAEAYFLKGMSLEDLEAQCKIGTGDEGPKGTTGRNIIKGVINAIKTGVFEPSFPKKVQELIDAVAEGNNGMVLDLARKHGVNTEKLEQIKKRYSVLVDAGLCGSDEACK